jgi:hypothetical protein
MQGMPNVDLLNIVKTSPKITGLISSIEINKRSGHEEMRNAGKTGVSRENVG